MKFVQLAKSLQEGLAPVYLVEGEDAYFRDRAVGSIRTACNLARPSLNDVRVEGETLKGDRLSSLPADLRAMPFFDERRLVRIYEFYPTEREYADVLKPYFDSPCPTTTLVIVNAAKGKKCDLARKGGVTVVNCAKETEDMLSRFVFGMCKRAGLTADGDAITLMVRYCNSDAARLRLETDKLALLLGEGGRVTADVVRDNVAKDTDYKIYELTQAASRGNFTQFSEILGDLLDKGSDESALLGALLSHFRTLSEISGMRGTDAEVAEKLGVKPFAVQKNREAASRLGAARVRELYLSLYALSADMRSGNCTKKGALSAAVAKIFYG